MHMWITHITPQTSNHNQPRKNLQPQRTATPVRPVVGLADLRRDTPCPTGTLTGAGATGAPRLRRGFGHLLAVDRPPKPRALTGRGGRLGSA
jgi:hypothetical protein